MRCQGGLRVKERASLRWATGPFALIQHLYVTAQGNRRDDVFGPIGDPRCG